MLNIDFNRIKSCCLLLFCGRWSLSSQLLSFSVCLCFPTVFELVRSSGVGPLTVEVVAVLAFAVGRVDHAIAGSSSPTGLQSVVGGCWVIPGAARSWRSFPLAAMPRRGAGCRGVSSFFTQASAVRTLLRLSAGCRRLVRSWGSRLSPGTRGGAGLPRKGLPALANVSLTVWSASLSLLLKCLGLRRVTQCHLPVRQRCRVCCRPGLWWELPPPAERAEAGTLSSRV